MAAGRFDGGAYRDAKGRPVVSAGDTSVGAIATGGASGDITLLAAQAQAVEILGFYMVAKGATDIQWKFGAATFGDPLGFAAGGGIVAAYANGAPVLICPAGQALKINNSLAAVVGGAFTYRLAD